MFPVVFNAANLNGSNGFVVNGMPPVGWSSVGSLSVASVDLNVDGYDDVVIANPNANLNESRGIVYVVYGTGSGFPAQINVTSLDGTTGFVMHCSMCEGWIGSAVSTAGDFNGDGFKDLIVGASNAQTTFVVFSNKQGFSAIFDLYSMQGSSGFSIFDPRMISYFGNSVSCAGDVNKDGYSDFLVGSPDLQTGGKTPGHTYLFYGNDTAQSYAFLPDLNGQNGYAINGTTIPLDTDFGYQVSGIGDVNEDGIDDMMSLGMLGGFVMFGGYNGGQASINMSNFQGYILSSQSGMHSISGGGDINGDNVSDIAVGGVSQGVMVFLGVKGLLPNYCYGNQVCNIDDELLPDEGFAFNCLEYNCGNTVSLKGDFNGDGLADLVACTPHLHENIGGCHIVYGSKYAFPTVNSTWLNGYNGFTINGLGTDENFGTDLCSYGNVNGDGFDDLIITSLNNVCVVLGQSSDAQIF